MKVALISSADYDPNTGVSGTRIAFRDALRELGVQADTYFMDDLKSFSGGLTDKVLFPWKVAWNKMKWNDYDVIDVASGDGWVLSSMRNRPTTVFSSHGLEHLAHRELLKESKNGHVNLSWKYPIYWGGFRLWEVAKSIKMSDVSIFLNENDKKYAINHFKVNPKSVYIVPNGIPDYFIGREFTRKKDDSKSIKIVQIGSYIQRKGIKYTSEVMNELLQKYPNIELTFLGTGCNRETVYQDYIPEVRSRVKVMEKYKHSELPELLEHYQINLFPSLSEGFGKTLIEAMACGLAPITFETPGPLDILTNMHDGLVVPRRNKELLRNALEKLINQPALLYDLQVNAYHTAQKYSWNQAAKQRLTVYENAIEVR